MMVSPEGPGYAAGLASSPPGLARLGTERAIAHDETPADGHLTLGQYELIFGWHFEVAEQEFRRATEPN